MPINITTRTLTPNDPFAKPSEARTPQDNDALSLWINLTYSCYVLLGPESKKIGVGRHLLPSTHVLILHCDETKRSCVVSSGHKARLGFQTYNSHLSYVTRGARKTLVHALELCDGVDTPSALGSLSSSLRASAERLGHRIEVVKLEVPSQACAVLFERATATVEWLLKSPHADFNDAQWPQLDVEDAFPTTWSMLKLLQAKLDVFHGTVSALPCIYNGRAYAERLPILSDEARTILAAVRRELAEAGKRGQSPIEYAKTTDLDAPLDGIPAPGLEATFRQLLVPLAASGPLCSVCAKLGVTKRCADCRVDFYCSVEHQREDWPHHRSW